MSRSLGIWIVAALLLLLLFGDEVKARICTSSPSFFICQASMSVQVDPAASNGTQVQFRALLPSLTTLECALFAIGFILCAFFSDDLRNWGIGLGSAGLLIWFLDFVEIL